MKAYGLTNKKNIIISIIITVMFILPMTNFCYAAGSTSELATDVIINDGSVDTTQYDLTDEEKEFIKKSKPLNLWLETENRPVMWQDEQTGLPQGIVTDIFDIITEITNLHFNYNMIDSETVIPVSDYTFEIRKSTPGENTPINGVYYSDALFYADYMLYYEKKVSFSPEHTYIIAMPKDREGLKSHLNNSSKNFKIIECENAAECFNALHNRKADLIMANYYTANDIIIRQNLTEIKQVPGSEEEFEFVIKSQADDAEIVFSIINKGLKQMEPDTIDNIILQYATAAVPDISLKYLSMRNPIATIVGLFILFVLIIIITYNIVNANYTRKQNAILEKSNEDLKLANSARMDFLSRMSHDIRTPMNVIIGMVGLALKEDSIEKKNDYLRKIDFSSEFLLGLVNDILDMNKLECGQVVLHEEPYSFEEFVKYVNDFLRPLYEEKNMNFKLTIIGKQVPWLSLDKLRFNQIFFNLLSNAVKYTPEGGKIELIIEQIAIENDYVISEYTIKDNGIGISPKFQEKLFEPFARENTELTNLSQGTGLGLSIVKSLVDMMGGQITVKSEENKGSEFKFRFKSKIIEPPETRPLKETNSTNSLKGCHVLLCEDHALNREIMNRILEKDGVIVSNAEDGLLAVEAFKRSPIGYFDIILMDIRMPVMDGLAATKEIRKLDRSDAKEITIIALTANAYDYDIQDALNAGMNSHLGKPVDLDDLHTALSDAFSKKQLKE